ncbi:Hsp20/alpha crystallin family protein [Thiospirochaeta perfilievii]|uniref:Hsp20/alpha crystallin family protein n=1 Tax=Thiospirochaeta perfilievii TaxID=252967 RepID=A0A5C1Q8F1_9SPIO|nr:Hsp20/alpha crystallin family protein [Thiospirochaeta perfilievii]QEN04363.1 Hsp20/alpha crystallin family protein [Thiospirochaeta perfilievii]
MAIVKLKNRNIYDPWEDFTRLQSEINELFNNDRIPKHSGLFDRNFTPAVNVSDSKSEYKITCELPGMEQSDIELSIVSNVLTIKGTKQKDKVSDKGKFYRKEIWEGSFQRTLSLPTDVDSEKIVAQLDNGFLSISVPKREEAKPKQITINVQ